MAYNIPLSSGFNPNAWRNEAQNLLLIVVGIAIYSIGFCVFILPHHIVIGGMAGFSTLIYYATSQTVPVAVTMYGTNLLLLVLSWKIVGRGFVFRTIFGATMMSAMIGALEGYFTSHPPLITDAPISLIIGAVLLGIGIGIYYSHHGTAGGTDIIAAVMTKVSNVSVGRVMMIVDISIVACSFLLPFDGDMEARVQSRTQSIMYGWIAIFLYSYIADRFIYQGHRTIQFLILSEKWERIAHRITHETGRGVTTWHTTGYWTGASKVMMMVWCRQVDTYQIYNIVHQEDPSAYITAANVSSVYGNGFDLLKPKHSKQSQSTEKH